MPPAPVDPPDKSGGENKNNVDLGKILLPKKEVPGSTIDSAQRVSAGVLLDQELKAGQEGIQNPTQPPRAPAPPVAKPEKKEGEGIEQLQTYQADIEKVMQGSNASIVSIAAAEAERRAQRGREEVPLEPAVPLKERAIAFLKKFSMVIGGLALLAASSGVLAYLLLRPTTVQVAPPPTSPFIAVDDTQTVSLSPGEQPRTLMSKLDSARQKVALSLGLVARLMPSVASTTGGEAFSIPMDTRTFLTIIAPNIPANFLRATEPAYLLGVHVYDSNQPFLILRVDSYQEAFSGMLAWEFYIKNDLAPLFSYTPAPRIQNLPPAATSTASSTPAASPPPAGDSFTQARFVDKIVENHDARVLLNNAGDIYLLWTFLDRNTLVITTNAATLREIISRLKEAPITSVPAQ